MESIVLIAGGSAGRDHCIMANAELRVDQRYDFGLDSLTSTAVIALYVLYIKFMCSFDHELLNRPYYIVPTY